jgi:hypothetical protein
MTWDRVPGATGYDILKDGVKVSSTRTATTVRLGASMGSHDYEIRPKPAGKSEFVTVNTVLA